MADDLEAFLRQAAQRRAQRQQGVARPAAPERPPAAAPPQQPPRQPPRTLTPQPARPAAARPQLRSPEIVTADVVPAVEKSRVGTRVSTREFETRAEQLGEEVGLADEHMEAHIAQRFDHQVGSLDLGDGTQAGAGTAEVAFDAAELIAMLKDPKTLRQAVLLSEILHPPDFSRS